ncbi:MAG TPA: hypothetical protein VFK26_09555 [Gemmatimonadaceae bacterium]|jgi:ElaB/YqjD/DUF883 family membrane-anchored ribosome-binding protein|nr:hypothetical protein [Gemmatimonadaceae bacterium]
MGNSIETTGGDAGYSTDGMSVAGAAARDQGINSAPESQPRSLVERAKSSAEDRVRSAAMTGRTRAIETVSGLAQSLRTGGQQLQDQGSTAANLVEQAADRLDSVARYLQNTELDEVVRKTETWARQNPALFVGSAFVVGLLGARFLKSSQRGISQQQSASLSSTSTFADREVPRSPVVEGA